ncbi:hypothetical protein [Kyrpidia sp.]|uniref:hypothetical protein n=1 Tax=Kyrpidia sp. TaxID=2073077 RepID=UPI00258747EB|nr:hypothetical protein [Kyrpidia sp.]MCL6577067.1 hypothetical protein [Kyrpidia sp.]
MRDVSRPGRGFAEASVDAWCDVSDGQKTRSRHLVLNGPVLRVDTGYVITAPPTILPRPALGLATAETGFHSQGRAAGRVRHGHAVRE